MTSNTRGGYLCPVNERMREQAREFTDSGDSDREKAERLFHWVRDTYCWDMTKIRGAGHLLREQPTRAMSFDKSNLLVSLLRSIDIPARFRMIKCTFYNEYKDRIDDSYHAPIEVKLGDDWITADPTFGKHTRRFKSVSEFGEETWETIEKSSRVVSLSRFFVLPYNYIARFFHPDIRKIRKELRECQDL